jgi:hypothetical protein
MFSLKLPDEAQEIIFVRIKSPNEIYLGTRNGFICILPQTQINHCDTLMAGLSISSVLFLILKTTCGFPPWKQEYI